MESIKFYTSEEVRAFVSKPQFDQGTLQRQDSSYPRISIVLCSYNQGKFLERTILSILNQNYPNTELIVIDGGSTDQSAGLIRQYGSYISYWVSEPDSGQPNAINKGLAQASGDLIGWQNSDDLYLPGYFYTVADSFRAEPAAQLFAGNIYTIDEHDRITWASRFAPFSIDHLVYLGWNISSQATFVAREVIERVGPLREDIQVEFDWDWFIRVGKLVDRSVLHRGFGGCYRIHSTSKLTTYSRESRRPIISDILRRHGVSVDESRTDEQAQWRWRRAFLKLRYYLLLGLVYFPVTRSGEIKRVPWPSISYPIISWLRAPALWLMGSMSRTRVR